MRKPGARLAMISCILLFCFVSGAFCGTKKQAGQAEIWKGSLPGMANGTLILEVETRKAAQSEKKVKGRLKMIIDSVAGGFGRGRCDGTITGRIKENVMKAAFSGTAYVSEGDAELTGTLKGEFSETSARGTYHFSTGMESYRGKWTLEKQ